jgi:hypothetical protein
LPGIASIREESGRLTPSQYVTSSDQPIARTCASTPSSGSARSAHRARLTVP